MVGLTRHAGYAISLQKRKRIESIFGWLKTTGNLPKLRHRGRARVQWMFTLALAGYPKAAAVKACAY